MARTRTEIKKSITDRFMLDENLVESYGLDNTQSFEDQFSLAAFENILIDVFVFLFWTLEKLFDNHKSEVTGILTVLKPHTARWYRQKALSFQWGFDLYSDTDVFNIEGFSQEQIANSKIIKYSAVTEAVNESRLIIKIATEDANQELSPIPEAEKESFDAYIDEIRDADAMFNAVKLTSLPNKLTLDLILNGSNMFGNSTLTSLPAGMVLDELTNGNGMFLNCVFSSLPAGMTLNKLTNGNQMFRGSKLTSLPTGMTLNKLIVGTQMFLGNNTLTQIPNLILSELIDGGSMFSGCKITSLPSSMNLDKLVTAATMFGDNNLTQFPANFTFPSLTVATQMLVRNPNFVGNVVISASQITSINGMFFTTKFNHDISGWDYSKNIVLANASFNPSTMNFAGYSPEYYSNFLIKIRNTVVGTGRTVGNKFMGFNCKYLPYAAAARADLVADGWEVRDSGLLT